MWQISTGSFCSGKSTLIVIIDRQKDVSRYKAEVAARVVMERCPGVNIKYFTDPVQKFPREFFAEFNVIIAGLDNVEARRWINSMVHSLVEFDKDGTPNA